VIIEFEKIEPSYVLRAIGAEEDLAHSSIRFGISRFTTEEEIDFTAETTIKHVKNLREMRFFDIYIQKNF
jgi:cysteine desulfurase